MDTDGMIEELAATPKKVAHLVAEASEAAMAGEREGEWSPRLILAHLRDNEMLVMRLRLERMLAEDRPVLTPFDEQAWAAGRNTARDRKEELLGDFALQRQASVAMLRMVRPAEWDRMATQPEFGAWEVRDWLVRCVDHDRTHIAQLEQVLGTTLEEVMARRFAHRDQ